MIDVPTIRREAGLIGHHEFEGPDDICPVCGMTVDDMLKMNRIPQCEPGRWIVRAMKDGKEDE